MKTEKEKMLAGELYSSFDKELLGARQHATEVLYEYNTLHPSEFEKRNELLVGLLGSTGEGFFIEQPFRCAYGYNIHWGKRSYANYNCTVLDCNIVNIGDNVLIGPNVNIFAAGHPVHPALRSKDLDCALPIVIGNNVWIGGGSTINGGVTIGDNTVIGSGSVVTKDIPANVVAGGNPCKVIRAITDADAMKYDK